MRKFAIITKKERWSTTWLGKIIGLGIIVLVVYLGIRNVHPYLAVSKPIPSEVMILEGFLPDFAIEESVKIFREENYKLMLVTGKKLIKGSLLVPFKDDGHYTAAILSHMGLDSALIKVISLNNDVKKDRTFASAKAVLDWMEQTDTRPQAVNVVSLGVHARRSRLLFEKAFSSKVETGIISISDIGYDANKWWESSYGFKTVLNETLAWFYVCFFFSGS